MSKKKSYFLAIAIPYYKNSEQCEKAFKKLMEQLNKQLTDDMFLYVYEDGQFSNWLWEYAQNKPQNIKIESNAKNRGVSFARNKMLNYLIDKSEYILYIDSDDYVDDNYLKVMYEYCADMTHEIIECTYIDYHKKFTFEKDKVRSGISGVAFKTSIVGDNRFDENRQIGEDTDFSYRVFDLKKYRKKLAKTTYYYQYGVNPNSLMKRYKRKEIGEMR